MSRKKENQLLQRSLSATEIPQSSQAENTLIISVNIAREMPSKHTFPTPF